MSNTNNYITSEEDGTIITNSNNSELDDYNENEEENNKNNNEINKENINYNENNISNSIDIKNLSSNNKKDNKKKYNNENEKKPENQKYITPKSTYSKISENLINYFYKTGKYPINVCLENLINDNFLLNQPSLKINLNKNQNDYSQNQKIISRFLERNAHNKINRILPESSAKEKGVIKAKLSSIKRSNNNYDKKHFSPYRHFEEEVKKREEVNKKIENERKKFEEEEKKLNQDKPYVSPNSKKLAQKKNNNNKSVYDRLFERTKSKEFFDNNKNNNINNIKKRKISKQDISNCINKLYNEGVQKTKKRSESNIPLHMEKVSKFYSRDFTSYSSNIRTNTKKDNFSPHLIQDKNLSQNNKIIMVNMISKKIDDIVFEYNITNVNFIDFYNYCILCYGIGFVLFNHSEIRNILNPEQYFLYYKNYDNFENRMDELNDDNISHPFTKNISVELLENEQNLLIKSFKCILNNYQNNYNENETITENDTITLEQFKLFSYIILGIFLGIMNSNKKKEGKPLSNYKTNSVLFNKKSLNKASSAKNICKDKEKKQYSPNSYSSVSPRTNISPNISYNNQGREEITTIYLKKNLPSINILSLPAKPIKKIRENFIYFNKINNEYKEYNRKSKEKNKLKYHLSQEQLTFKPKVNERGESLKLEQTYNIIQQRHNNQIDKLQKQKIDNELKECTFNPNNKIINPSKSIEISNRLYNVCKKKKSVESMQSIITAQNDKKDKECTFNPKLISDLDENIFIDNPIKDDALTNQKVEQYEKARIQRKLIDFAQSKGGNLMMRIKNNEELVKEFNNQPQYESFKFGIERKTNKDTFDTFNDNKKFSNFCPKKETPLFTIEVKIKEKIELLDYYKNDDPVEITKKFCALHNLGESSNEKILAVIEEKLKDSTISDSN